MKILILGAGIIGLTTAYQLIQRGHHVKLIERKQAPGQLSSYMNGGQFSYSYAEPLSSPTIPSQLPTMLLGRHSALSIQSAAFPQLLPWGLKFLLNCKTEKFLENTQHILKLAKLSRKEMDRYIRVEGTDFDFRQTGKLHLYRSDHQLQRAAMLVKVKNRLGFQQEIWSQEQCRAKEPALKDFHAPISGGIFSPLDQSGDTFKLIQKLTDACLQSEQGELLSDTEAKSFDIKHNIINSVITSKGKIFADIYVVCAGTESLHLMKTLGVTIPILPVKGYSITVPALQQSPEINLTETHHKIVFTKLGKHLRVAGLMEFAGNNLQMKADRIKHLLALAKATLPFAGDYKHLLASWTGHRPMTPDGVPVIGPTQWENLWLNVGHGMLGSTLGFGSARLIADLIDDKDSELDATPYHPGRFA